MDPKEMQDVMGKHDPLGDAITIALVLVTLFGALIAWRQADAHFEHDEATVRAEEWTLLASSQSSRANQANQLQTGRRRQARRDRMGAEKALGQAIFGAGDRTLLALEVRHWGQRARRTKLESGRLVRESRAEMQDIEAGVKGAFRGIDPALGRTGSCKAQPATGLQAAPGAGLGRSPPAAGGYPAEMQREAFRMEGRRDAAAETAVRAEAQFTHYAAALALIAVALFFFGYTLTKYGFRFRKVFALLAVGLTLLSAYLAVKAFLDAPPKPRAAAAAAYADGLVALGGGEAQVALKDFACATRLNPNFAAAFLEKSRAFDQLGMPRDVAVANESLENRTNLREAFKYGRRARQLDPEDPHALVQIATALFVHGVSDRVPLALSHALALDRRLEGAMPDDPIQAFNAAATLLALDQPWQASYRLAEELMEATPQQLAYVGGALTDLDYLEASGLRPGLADAARRAKEQVVAAVSATDTGAPQRRGRASVGGIRLRMTPVAAVLSFTAKGLDLGRDQLFAALYRQRQLGWEEIQQLPGSLAPGSVVPGPAPGGYRTVIWSNSSTSCLGDAEYKVELYINGQLASVGPVSGGAVHLPPLAHRELPGMNLGLCTPGPGWQRISHRAAGLLDGFERQGDGGREGIIAFDFSESPARGAGQIGATLLGRFSPPLPRGAKPVGPPIGPLQIGGLTKARVMTYAYANGKMDLVTATTQIGRKLAIGVFGPPPFFTLRFGSSRSLAQILLESLTTYDPARGSSDSTR